MTKRTLERLILPLAAVIAIVIFSFLTCSTVKADDAEFMGTQCDATKCEDVYVSGIQDGPDPVSYLVRRTLGVCDNIVDCAAHANKVCLEKSHGQAKSSTLAADSGSTNGQACVYTCEDGKSFKAICIETVRPPQQALWEF